MILLIIYGVCCVLTALIVSLLWRMDLKEGHDITLQVVLLSIVLIVLSPIFLIPLTAFLISENKDAVIIRSKEENDEDKS